MWWNATGSLIIHQDHVEPVRSAVVMAGGFKTVSKFWHSSPAGPPPFLHFAVTVGLTGGGIASDVSAVTV